MFLNNINNDRNGELYQGLENDFASRHGKVYSKSVGYALLRAMNYFHL